MNRKDEYRDYLRSDRWAELRKAARNRAGDACEMCAGPADHVHHIRYPKRFKDDHIDNLLVLCEPCHQKTHGIRLETVMQHELMIFRYEGVHGAHNIGAVSHNGEPMFDLEAVLRVLEIEADTFENARNKSGQVSGLYSVRQAMNGLVNDGEFCDREVIDVGIKRVKRFVAEDVVYRLIFRSNAPPALRFQKWVTKEVLPSIRKTGGYQMQRPEDDDPFVQQALQIVEVTRRVVRLEKTQERLSLEQQHNASQLQSALQQLDELSGGDFYKTVRLRMAQHGVRYDQETAKVIGGRCREIHLSRGLEIPPKIQEGTYLVNQWSIEVLDEVMGDMGLIN